MRQISRTLCFIGFLSIFRLKRWTENYPFNYSSKKYLPSNMDFYQRACESTFKSYQAKGIMQFIMKDNFSFEKSLTFQICILFFKR